MSVRVVSLSSKIAADSDTNLSLGLRFMIEDIERISKPLTPKDTGDLRRRVLKTVLGRTATIIWNTDYAIYQEDKQHKNYTTPGTGPHFAENAVKQVMNNAESYFKRSGIA